MPRRLQRVGRGTASPGASAKNTEYAAVARDIHGYQNQNVAARGGCGELRCFLIAAGGYPGEKDRGDAEDGGEFWGECEREKQSGEIKTNPPGFRADAENDAPEIQSGGKAVAFRAQKSLLRASDAKDGGHTSSGLQQADIHAPQ